jgi:hypothetical protein
MDLAPPRLLLEELGLGRLWDRRAWRAMIAVFVLPNLHFISRNRLLFCGNKLTPAMFYLCGRVMAAVGLGAAL